MAPVALWLAREVSPVLLCWSTPGKRSTSDNIAVLGERPHGGWYGRHGGLECRGAFHGGVEDVACQGQPSRCRRSCNDRQVLSVDFLDPGQGFEPRLLGPGPSVLPLDEPGMDREVRFELTTSRTKTWRYFHLSYSPRRTCSSRRGSVLLPRG